MQEKSKQDLKFEDVNPLTLSKEEFNATGGQIKDSQSCTIIEAPLVLKDGYTEAVAAGVVSGSMRTGSDLNSKLTEDNNNSKDVNDQTDVPLEYTQTLEATNINKQITQNEIDGVYVTIPLEKHTKNVVSSIELVKMGDPLEKVEEEEITQHKKESGDYINQPSSGSGSMKNMKTMFQNEPVDVSAKSSGSFAKPPVPKQKPSLIFDKNQSMQNYSISEQKESVSAPSHSLNQTINDQTPSENMNIESQVNTKGKTELKQKAEGSPADKLLHRLPNNYFIQDDDEEDLDTVMTNIQNMRKDMLNYVQENDMDSKMQRELQNIANINDIIQPQKFIERHYQVPEQSGSTTGQPNVNANVLASFDVEPPQYLFESILKEKPSAVQKQDLVKQLREEEQFETEHDPDSPQLKQIKSNLNAQNINQIKSPEFAGTRIESPDYAKEPSLNNVQNTEPVVHSPELNPQPRQSFDLWGNDDEIDQAQNTTQLQLFQERTSNQEVESIVTKGDAQDFTEATQHGVAEFNLDALGSESNAESSHTPLVGITTGPRVMKMADYFNQPKEMDSSTLQTKDPNQSQQQQVFAKGAYPLDLTQDKFEQQLEQEILRNVDINFLFFKGKNLQDGLIDSKRLHQIMKKIKELAKSQLASGSKDIDYQQLIEFLKNKDLGFVPDDRDQDFQEPTKGDGDQEERAQWTNVVEFMRSNPKLLMQMIPDPEQLQISQYQSDCVLQADQVFKRSRAYDKIQQAQKYQKLQKLSQNFVSKRHVNTYKSESGQAQRPFSGYMSQNETNNDQSRYMSLSSVNSRAPGLKQNQGSLSFNKQYSSHNKQGYLSTKHAQNTFMQGEQILGERDIDANMPPIENSNYQAVQMMDNSQKRERQKSANSYASVYGQRNYMSSYSSTFGNQNNVQDKSIKEPVRKTPIMSTKTHESNRSTSKNIIKSRIIPQSNLVDFNSENVQKTQKNSSIGYRAQEQFNQQILKPVTNAYSHVSSRVYDSKPKYQVPLNDQTNFQLPSMPKTAKQPQIIKKANEQNSDRQNSQRKDKVNIKNEENNKEFNSSVIQSEQNSNNQINLFKKNPKFITHVNGTQAPSEQNDQGHIGSYNSIRFHKAPRPTTAKGIIQQRAINMPQISGTPGKRGAVNTSQVLNSGKLDTSLNNHGNFSQNSIFNGAESTKFGKQKSNIQELQTSKNELKSSHGPPPKFIKARNFKSGNISQDRQQNQNSFSTSGPQKYGVYYQACKYQPILTDSKGKGQKLSSSLSAAGASSTYHQKLKERVATENVMMFQSLSSQQEIKTEQNQSINIQSQKLNQTNKINQKQSIQTNHQTQKQSPQIRYPPSQAQVSPNRYTPKPIKRISISRSRSRSKSHKSRNSVESPSKRQILTGTGGNPCMNIQTSTTELQQQANVHFSNQGDKSDKRGQISKFAKSKSKSPARLSSAKSGKRSVQRSTVALKCEMSVQTEIRGIEHYIQIRPDKFDSDPFLEKSDLGKVEENDPLNVSQNASTIMSEKRGNLPQYKVPVINWSDTEIYQSYLSNTTSPHILSSELNRYTEGEIDYVLNMIKKSYQDFKRTDIMKPFYMKALDTLKFLLIEQSIEPIFDRVAHEYKEITLENTMKLLIRCKLAFSSRNSLITMFQSITEYDSEMEETKRLVETVQSHKIEEGQFNQIQIQARKVMEAARKVLQQADTLKKSSHRQFKNKTFIFQHKEMVIFIKKELTHIRRIITSFKITDPNASQSINLGMDEYITLLPNVDDMPEQNDK